MTHEISTGSVGGVVSTDSRTEKPAHSLIYHAETHDYRGTASDGALVVVAEHVFAERVRALAHTMAAQNGGAPGAAAVYQRFHHAAIALLSNAGAWREK